MKCRTGLIGAALLAGALCGEPVDAGMVLSAAPAGGGTPPSGPVPTITPGTTTVGAAQTCNPGTWTGTPTPTLGYQWDRNAVAISGATSAGYTIATPDQGTTLTCVVTGTNTAGSSSQTSAGLVIPGAGPTGNCAASTAFFNRVYGAPISATLDGALGTASGTPPIVSGGTGHLGNYDMLICNLGADGVWTKLDALWMPATNTVTGNAQAVANLNLVSSNYTLVPNGSPPFTPDRGYGGTGVTDGNTTMWLDTGLNLATASPSPKAGTIPGESHVSVWSVSPGTVQSTGFGKAMGSGNPGPTPLPLTSSITVIPRDSGNQMDCAVGIDVSNTTPAASVPDSAGSSLCEQSGGSTLIFRAGAEVGNIIRGTASAWSGVNIYLLNWNWTTKNGGPWQIGQASVGASLSNAQIANPPGTNGTGLVPRVCNYLKAVGAVASC